MKRFVVVFVLLLVFILSGCINPITQNTDGNKGLSGDTPPNVSIEIDSETYETILGSYCWDISQGESECVDTAGPVDLLKDKEPIQIKAGEEIKLNMDYTPKPNKIHLLQIENDDEMEIEINDNQFTAPNEKGTYFYSYGVWWMDEEDEDLSHGDAFYVFSLEVK